MSDFFQTCPKITHSNIFVKGTELDVVTKFKYLGVALDSTLTFKSLVKKGVSYIKFNLLNFRHIRNSLTENAARTFLHSMIFAHLVYCLTSWSLTCTATLNHIESLNKRALKVFDKKPQTHPFCHILTKHTFFKSFNNLISLKEASIIYKVIKWSNISSAEQVHQTETCLRPSSHQSLRQRWLLSHTGAAPLVRRFCLSKAANSGREYHLLLGSA